MYSAKEISEKLSKDGFPEMTQRKINYYIYDKKIFEVTNTGKSVFSEDDYCKLKTIALLKRHTNFSLEKIKELINTYTCEDIKKMMKTSANAIETVSKSPQLVQETGVSKSSHDVSSTSTDSSFQTGKYFTYVNPLTKDMDAKCTGLTSASSKSYATATQIDTHDINPTTKDKLSNINDCSTTGTLTNFPLNWSSPPDYYTGTPWTLPVGPSDIPYPVGPSDVPYPFGQQTFPLEKIVDQGYTDTVTTSPTLNKKIDNVQTISRIELAKGITLDFTNEADKNLVDKIIKIVKVLS